MQKCCCLIFILCLFSSLLQAEVSTRDTILLMEQECKAGGHKAPTAALIKLDIQCYPYIDHGGDATPDTIDSTRLHSEQKAVLEVMQRYIDASVQRDTDAVAAVLAEDFAIIQLGGNAWTKDAHLQGGVAHVNRMFSELYFDIEPVRIFLAGDNAATIVASYRMGGMHMGKPATTFGLSTINFVKTNDQWLIQHIHNSGMQAY